MGSPSPWRQTCQETKKFTEMATLLAAIAHLSLVRKKVLKSTEDLSIWFRWHLLNHFVVRHVEKNSQEYVATPKYTPSIFFSDSSLFEKRGSNKLNTIKCNMRKYVLIIPT